MYLLGIIWTVNTYLYFHSIIFIALLRISWDASEKEIIKQRGRKKKPEYLADKKSTYLR